MELIRGVTTLSELGRARAEESGAAIAFRFLERRHGEQGVVLPRISFGNLDRIARAIGASLARTAVPGDRALLIYPPGLHFAPAFLACCHAGLIAVPLPQPSRRATRGELAPLLAAVEDLQPSLVLTTLEVAALKPRLECPAEGIRTMTWIMTDEITPEEGEGWTPSPTGEDELACLFPGRGAAEDGRLRNCDLLEWARALAGRCRYTRDSIAVTWLCPADPEGLAHGLLVPLLTGCPSYVLPAALIRSSPLVWLDAMSRTHATHSGGTPDSFALCAEQASEKGCATLELSNWKVAYSAGSPLSPALRVSFARAFEQCGFRLDSFLDGGELHG